MPAKEKLVIAIEAPVKKDTRVLKVDAVHHDKLFKLSQELGVSMLSITNAILETALENADIQVKQVSVSWGDKN